MHGNFHRTIVPQGFVSLSQACKDLGVSRPTLNRWVRKVDDIFKIIVNEVHYIREEDVEKIGKERTRVLAEQENARTAR